MIEFVQQLNAAGYIEEMNPADYPFDDMLHEDFTKFPGHWKDGKLYSMMLRGGHLGVSYNKNAVSAEEAIDAEVRIYDRLFTVPNPMDSEEGKDFTDYINTDSLEVKKSCKLEPSLKQARSGDKFQFERLGYFVVDPDTTDDNLVFNRTVTLKDTWARIEKQRAKEKMEENRRRKQEEKQKQKDAAKKE